MKIILTTDTFYPMINGVVISTMNLYNQLRNIGHDVKIVALSNSGEEKVEGDIYYIDSFGVNIYPGARVMNPFSNRLINELIEWKPDLVHSQTEFSAIIISKKIAGRCFIPHVHTYHTMYEDYLKYIGNGRLITKVMANKFTKKLLNALDGILAPTEKVKKALLSYGVVKDIYVAPTGMEIDRFRKRITDEEKAEMLSQYNIHENKVLLYLGRIAEEKNIQEVIHFFSSYARAKSDTVLLIVGGGPYLESLEHIVYGLKLQDKVKFTGMVSPEQVYKYYQLGDVFVTSSTSETQGLTYIEALASGLPVICRYDTCIEDLIINGENGFTFNNEEEFVSAADRVCSMDNLLEEMRCKAAKKAEEYSCQVFGENVCNVYSRVLMNFSYEKRKNLFSILSRIHG